MAKKIRLFSVIMLALVMFVGVINVSYADDITIEDIMNADGVMTIDLLEEYCAEVESAKNSVILSENLLIIAIIMSILCIGLSILSIDFNLVSLIVPILLISLSFFSVKERKTNYKIKEDNYIRYAAMLQETEEFRENTKSRALEMEGIKKEDIDMGLVNASYKGISKDELSKSIAEKYKYYYVTNSSEIIDIYDLIDREIPKYNKEIAINLKSNAIKK